MNTVEKYNSITHLIGSAMALAGLSVLVVLASFQGDPWKIVSFSIYGFCLFLLYFFSTIYHSHSGSKKTVLQKLDHAAIYLLIAGTYTPFTLISLRGALGWSIFGIVWGLAVIGIVLDTVNVLKTLSLVIYILMGWIGIIALKPLVASLSFSGFAWLLAGGIFYTGGIVFFLMDTKYPFYHVIWHFFVMAGSLCHYIAILIHVL